MLNSTSFCPGASLQRVAVIIVPSLLTQLHDVLTLQYQTLLSNNMLCYLRPRNRQIVDHNISRFGLMRDPLSILIRKYINKPQQRSPDPSHSVSCLSHRHFSRILPPNHSLRSISNVFVARRMHYRRNRRYPLLADADSRLPLSTFITYQLSEHPAIHLISGHLNDLK